MTNRGSNIEENKQESRILNRWVDECVRWAAKYYPEAKITRKQVIAEFKSLKTIHMEGIVTGIISMKED